jgi:hypothetical protein
LPGFTIPDLFLQTQKQLLNSVFKYPIPDSTGDRRDSYSMPQSAPRPSESSTSTRKVWRPPQPGDDILPPKRSSTSTASGAAAHQGSSLDRRTSDSGSMKSFSYQAWFSDATVSPVNARLYHAEPEDLQSFDGVGEHGSGSDSNDESGDSDDEAEERSYGRHYHGRDWTMPTPERRHPVPIASNHGASNHRLWRPSMESVNANPQQTGTRRVPGSSLERMSTQESQGAGLSTRTHGRTSVDISNATNRPPWGSADSDPASWRSSDNGWSALQQPKPPMGPSRSPAGTGSRSVAHFTENKYAPSSNIEREGPNVQPSRTGASLNRSRAQGKEIQKFSSNTSPAFVPDSVRSTRISPPDGEIAVAGRNRSDSDTVSIQSGKFWSPSPAAHAQAQQTTSPPPLGPSRNMDRQASYGEPSRSPQFTRVANDISRSHNVSPAVQRHGESRSRSPPRPERSRTYDGEFRLY